MENKKDISINVGSGVPKSDIQLNTHDNIIDDIDLEAITAKKIQHYDINDKFILNEVNNKTHWNKPFFKGQSRA
jgi:hypothetical protein